METKIIGVNHINYDSQYSKELYFFKSTDDIKKDDIVLCDTRNGAALGIVREVIDVISAEELLKSKFYSFFQKGLTIRQCKLLPNYSDIELSPEEEKPLPF